MTHNKFFGSTCKALCVAGLLFTGCTKLDEQLYDTITSDNFLQTKADVVRDFLRPFEHAYWSTQGNQTFMMQENTSDECATINREGDWFDGAQYQRAHYHTWTAQDTYTSDAWTAFYQGIVLATNSLEDMESITDPAKFELAQADIDDYKAELRTLRAWFTLRAFDFYRNIPIITKVKGEILSQPQAKPQEVFDFIEKELTESIATLPTRESLGANAIGRWTKGAAAALLVRLYLNASVYIGTDKFTECQQVCQDIINGKYGNYTLESRWDAPFDYTNNTSAEVMFGFPSSLNLTHWQYAADYGGGSDWLSLPYQAPRYCGFTDFGDANPKYSLQPGRNVDSVEYGFSLGKPFVKFQHYPDDYRLKVYKNLGGSKREGMFLYGYLPFINSEGKQDSVRGNKGPYALFIRDMVGLFQATPPGVRIADKESDMNHGDHNSGVFPVKYPIYPSSDDNRVTSAYAEIRLAEIYYSLAECKYRAGDKPGAAALLNAVRQRNYPAGSPSLYKADGSQLSDQEMLDEWGREFLWEGRRRTDLIRWGVFNTGTWWDKQPDGDNHTAIFPIGQSIINASTGNAKLQQNTGY